MEPNETGSTPAVPEASQDAADAERGERDSDRQSSAAVGRTSWLAYLLVAVVAGVLGLCGPPVIDWLRRGIPEAVNARPGGPLGAGSAPGVPGGETPSGNVPSPLDATPREPVAGATPAEDPLPKADSPLPKTQAELAQEVNFVTEYLLKCFPDDPDALEVKARYQDWLGNSVEALGLWERCLQLNPNYGYAHYGMGTVAAKRGEYAKAAELFRKALASSPEWPKAEVELARALLDLGRSEEAAATLEKHVQRPRFMTEAHFLLGQAYGQRKDYPKAKESYAKAIQLNARTSDAYYGLATLCTRLGEQDQAKKYLEKLNELRGKESESVKRDRMDYNDLEAMKVDTASICTSAGQLFFVRKRQAEAEKLWRRAAAFDPLQVECRQALAWLCRESDRVPEAIGFLQDLGKIAPKNIEYLLEAGRLQTELKQFDAAEATFNTVRERVPQEAAGHAALARLYLAANRKLMDARGLAEKAAELERTPANYVVLAAICEKLNDLAAATEAMKRAMELDRNNPGYQKAYEWLKTRQSGK